MPRISPLVLLAATLAARLAAAGGEAPLPAVLEGDPALVAAIGAGLAGRGIATPARSEGDAVRVSVVRAQGGDGILLTIRDPQGRTLERLVATPDTAVALIESWTRPEIAEPLLAPRAAAVAPPPAASVVPTPAAPVAPTPTIHREARMPPAAATPSPWVPLLRLGGETSADVERTWWLSASVGACGRVGPLCLGAEARVARLFDEAWDVVDHRVVTRTESRSDWVALMTADLPIPLGRPTLIVGLGIGLGRRIGSGAGAVAPRSEVRASLALPLWSQLAIDLGLTATLDPRDDDGDVGAPGFTPSRPAGGHLRAGIGLRWGMP
jgi:hypothetical protein